jgi:uncharacterized protein (DUF488 family)
MNLTQKTAYSLGHSNHPIEIFLSLLETHQIGVLVDVRSYPFSRHAPQFDRPTLSIQVAKTGSKYLYLGKELGGGPEDGRYYDENGYVLYSEWARSTLFLTGIDRLVEGVTRFRIAILCSEENPSQCHRRLLITPILIQRGIEVLHIRGDATLECETDLLRRDKQPSLFTSSEGVLWKSLRSVSPKRLPRNSSAS